MEQKNFSLDEAWAIYNSANMKEDKLENVIKGTKITKVKEVRDIKSTCDYIQKYFFTLADDNHAVREGDTFNIYTRTAVKNVYFNRLPKEICTWYFKENRKIYSIINELNKPLIGENTINLCKTFLHKSVKKYSEYSTEIHEAIKIFLDYMKLCLCSNKDDQFQYLLKWLSYMVKGNKNDSALYLKGPEGTGKSTFLEFLAGYVLGDLYLKSNDQPFKPQGFNRSLCGKLLVAFEELPTYSENEWSAVSGRIKDMVTGTTLMYHDKNEKSFVAKNINNYIIATNVEALKDSQGRRFFILDLSTIHLQDHEYFGYIKSKCYSMEVGEAFFSYLLEIDTQKFNSQADMPVTDNKKNAIADNLDCAFKYIKYEYILKRRDINLKVDEFYQGYIEYCRQSGKKALTKIKFCKKLGEYQINYRKSNGHNYFKYTCAELEAIAKRHNWIHDLDEYEDYGEKPDPLEFGIQKVPDKNQDDIIKELKDQVAHLQKLLKERDDEIQNLKTKPEEPKEIKEELKPKKGKSLKQLYQNDCKDKVTIKVKRVDEVDEDIKFIINN
jgi:hypothetical protein